MMHMFWTMQIVPGSVGQDKGLTSLPPVPRLKTGFINSLPHSKGMLHTGTIKRDWNPHWDPWGGMRMYAIFLFFFSFGFQLHFFLREWKTKNRTKQNNPTHCSNHQGPLCLPLTCSCRSGFKMRSYGCCSDWNKLVLIADQPSVKEATSGGDELMKKWAWFGSVMGFMPPASVSGMRL